MTLLHQVDILELLAQQGEDHWLPWQQKRPLLHIACERGAWNCVKYLVSGRYSNGWRYEILYLSSALLFLLALFTIF